MSGFDKPNVCNVPFKMEIITVEEDSMIIGPDGDKSIGETVDLMLDDAITNGQRLGKITLDLSEYTETFAVFDNATAARQARHDERAD